MASLLRRRVQIYFKDDPQPKWYDGEVAEYSQTDKQHLIRFDDGDQNWYDIDEEESATTLRWLEPTVALKSKRTQPVRPEAEDDVAKKQRGTVTGKRGQTQSQTLMSPVSVLAPAQTLMLAPGATSWTREDFTCKGFFHLNSLVTEQWAPGQNVAFFPFLCEDAGTPYFFSSFFTTHDSVIEACKNGASYKDVRRLLCDGIGGYGENMCTQLATWLRKVSVGDYVIMRHNTTHTLDGLRPSRGVYAIGRVASTSHPGSDEAKEIAARVSARLKAHEGYAWHYEPDESSTDYKVEWRKVGFLPWPASLQRYISGQQTKTISDRLCSRAHTVPEHREFLHYLWDNAAVDIDRNSQDVEAIVKSLMFPSQSAPLVVD